MSTLCTSKERDATMPSEPNSGCALHEALIAGDETAPARIVETYLDTLVKRLRANNPAVWWRDPMLIEAAAADALFNYIQRPMSYDPRRRSLGGYLLMSAQGDLRNALE